MEIRYDNGIKLKPFGRLERRHMNITKLLTSPLLIALTIVESDILKIVLNEVVEIIYRLTPRAENCDVMSRSLIISNDLFDCLILLTILTTKYSILRYK